MPTCKRCGICCILKINGQRGTKRCPFLVGKVGGITSCRIYPNRVGKKLGHNNTCVEREKSDEIFKGCPYNKEEEKNE